MTKHTPGPWHLGEKFATNIDGFPVNAVSLSAHGQAIARIWAGRDLTMGNEDANARLIAAAPEMLMALKDIAASADAGALSYDDHELRSLLEKIRDLYARAAIAKAEGKS